MSSNQAIVPRMKVIIFSKDRPMQLDALLRSLKYHCKDLDVADIYILFHSTNHQYYRQYLQLSETYQNIAFIKQSSFRRNLIYLLQTKNAGFDSNLWKMLIPLPAPMRRSIIRSIQIPDNEYIFFLVDDTVFIRTFHILDIVNCLQQIPGLLGFSLRLGENTNYCYPFKKSQALPQFLEFTPSIIYYRWSGAECDFGYPLEVSSSVYRLRDIAPLLLTLSYKNPNTLEAAIAAVTFKYIDTLPYLACYKTSVAFSIPMNRVQDEEKNRFGELISYGVKELADRFDGGEYIDIEGISEIIPNACHQEVEIKFKRNCSAI